VWIERDNDANGDDGQQYKHLAPTDQPQWFAIANPQRNALPKGKDERDDEQPNTPDAKCFGLTKKMMHRLPG
jgi:hypothetical protein